MTLTIIVIKGDGPTLLGRDWLQYFRLDWSSIKTVKYKHSTELNSILSKFEDVFSDELGTIKEFKAKLSVSSTATARFHCPRHVPFAVKVSVEEELHRLEKNGVLVKLDHSEWAAPIVTVPKKDGKIRFCGDYKVTINPILEVDQYPLPRPIDLFATLAGGKYFSKLDLSQAYNQIQVDAESQKFWQLIHIEGYIDTPDYLLE